MRSPKAGTLMNMGQHTMTPRRHLRNLRQIQLIQRRNAGSLRRSPRRFIPQPDIIVEYPVSKRPTNRPTGQCEEFGKARHLMLNVTETKGGMQYAFRMGPPQKRYNTARGPPCGGVSFDIAFPKPKKAATNQIRSREVAIPSRNPKNVTKFSQPVMPVIMVAPNQSVNLRVNSKFRRK